MWLDRINAWLLSALLVLAPIAAQASQNALLSPTTGTVSGLQLTNNYNNALDSLNTANSGASAPTNQLTGVPSLGNVWLNTTSAPYPWGMYDGASWAALANLDPTAHAWNVQIGGGVSTLASASSVDLCSTARNYLTISGNTTINSFGSTCPAGVMKVVTFSGTPIVTYNAVSLIIPGAASISPAAVGDQALLIALGSGNWQVAMYQPASGAALINPAVDVGTYQFTSAVSVPSSKYLLAFGQAISRTTYATYLGISTITQSVTRTNGSPTLTGFSDTTQIRAGAPLEGSGIPSGATVGSTTSTTVTMASTCGGGSGACNATSSGTANVQIFPNGNGDGSTTFNMPNCADVMLAGRGNMSGTPRGVLTSTYVGASPDALGVFGGSQSHINTLSETPTGITVDPSALRLGLGSNVLPLATTPGATVSSVQVTTGSGNTVPGTSAGGWGSVPGSTVALTGTVTSNNTGGAAHSIVPPIMTANCMVRVLALLDAPSLPNSFAANDNGLPIVADRRRIA